MRNLFLILAVVCAASSAHADSGAPISASDPSTYMNPTLYSAEVQAVQQRDATIAEWQKIGDNAARSTSMAAAIGDPWLIVETDQAFPPAR